jgi:predicted transcriptional regulator
MQKKEDLKLKKQIENLASFGLNNTEISQVMGIDDSTLKRNFEKFLTKGRAVLKQKLKRKQIQVALQGNVSMLIWLGKQYLEQKDKAEESGELKINFVRKRLEDKIEEEKKNGK